MRWFSRLLRHDGMRVMCFASSQRCLEPTQWTGNLRAPVAFADGFPLLLTSTTSLAELNERLQAAGHTPVGTKCFRPNLVIDGVHAQDEDRLSELRIITANGPVVLRSVKLYLRCPTPNVDLGTGHTSPDVLQVLSTFRAHPVLDGAITFVMNCAIVEGVVRCFAVGDVVEADWKLDEA